ncbi:MULTISPECIES: DUF7283 family protein [Salinibaculum]|uniref:DUF7283 family protein n=1 Tax=Salinibaculum TaxID=2732368 RepID=UPI0030D099B4
MFDAPLDTWYVWLGLGLVSVAVAGTALSLPTAAPPSPGPVADAIDEVASSPGSARARVTLSASRIRLAPRELALRSDGGTARARFAFGPVTPVDSGPLARVLHGRPPASAFPSKTAFRDALRAARRESPRWRPAPDGLTARRVRWGDVDATLVG